MPPKKPLDGLLVSQRILDTENLTAMRVQGRLPLRIAVQNGSGSSNLNRLLECSVILLGNSVVFYRC